MPKLIGIQSKYGEFNLLIDEEDSDVVAKSLFVRKQRQSSGSISYLAVASANGYNRGNKDLRGVQTLIAEKCLKRPLKKNEVVHHFDSDSFNCRRRNLLVSRRSEHSYLHARMSKEYAKTAFQSPLNGEKIQLLHRLLSHNTQVVSGIRIVV